MKHAKFSSCGQRFHATALTRAGGPVHKCATQLPAAAGSIFTQIRELHLRILLVCRAYASVQDGSHSINPLAGDRLSATITAPTICGKIHSVNNCFSNARGFASATVWCLVSTQWTTRKFWKDAREPSSEFRFRGRSERSGPPNL